MRTRHAVIAFALCAAGMGLAQASDTRLAKQISAIVDGPNYKHARWGILVVESDSGKVVYERNADQMFVPASTTKLYSCASALHYLGPDYRFETPVYSRGSVNNGQLKGDLVLVASGDLSLGGRTRPDGTMAFANNDHTYADNTTTMDSLIAPDPLTGLLALARQIKSAGINSVSGEVLIDARLFESSTSSGSGPRHVSPILVNDNVIDIVVAPSSEADKPALVQLRPEASTVLLDAQVLTTADGAARIEVSSPGQGRLVVRGQIPLKTKPQLRTHAVEDPAAFARALLIDALRREGVHVAASGLREPKVNLPDRDAYDRLTRVATFTSPPLSETVKVTLKVSHNLYASTLPLLVAAKHGERTLAAGLKLQRQFLTDLGVDANSISFAGGAGGAQADSTTPRATVSLLRALATRPQWPAFEAGLPVLGVDGTLASSISADSPARGHVRAKTGTLGYDDVLNGRTLLRSKTLAGVMTTAEGKKLAFAMFVNDLPLPAGVTSAHESKALGRLCEVLFTFAE